MVQVLWRRLDRPVGPIEIQSKWKKDRLVVKMKTEQGGLITEEYQFSPDGSRLYVTVALERRGRSFSYQRVYDPVDVREGAWAGAA